MTQRWSASPRIPSRTAAAILAAVVLSAFLPAFAAAAGPVTLQARALVAGRFENGGWLAVSVSLENAGEPVSGYLAADGEDGTVRRRVELPAGSRKQVTLYVRPAAFARTVAVRFEDGDGTRHAEGVADVRVLELSRGRVAVVGDTGGSLRPQLDARAANLPEPIALDVADLPERPEPMRGLDAMVWAADSSSMSEAQRRALETWVAGGGQLVVIGGPDWQARTSGLATLLPVEGIRSQDDVSLEELARWSGASPPEVAGPVTASVGALRDGAVALAGLEEATSFATATHGAGRVVFLGVDLATEAFAGWEGAPLLWGRVLPDDRRAEEFVGDGPQEADVGYVLTEALANLPALEVPPAELLLGVLVAYILLIGPVSYAVLGRLDRRELAWVTAPILVLAFSGGSYGIGLAMKGTDIILNEVAVIRTTSGASAASVSTFAGVYSPSRARYDLVARGEALFSGLQSPFGDGVRQPGRTTEQGELSRLEDLAVGAVGLEAVRADATIAYAPALSVRWALTADGVSGVVTNVGSVPLEDVAVVSTGGGLLVGGLEAGASREFEVSGRNLTDSAASDQVYGRAGIDATSESQRRIALRRNVIDALVGYGGLPGKGLAGAVAGPYVIGWRLDDAPLALEVEGHRVQHYSQAVEVLAGRPRLGPGPVVIDPAQMSTQLLALRGDASEPDPGWVTLGEGEVVFQVGLPLEAAGLQPTAVTILAAGDPGALFHDLTDEVLSPLPGGYRISVFDHAAGEWLDLGDLATGSRFEVEDPSRVLDHAGRLEIMISASDVPDEMGRFTVFAGAQVEGVIQP